jgi:hypothetical protein
VSTGRSPVEAKEEPCECVGALFSRAFERALRWPLI